MNYTNSKKIKEYLDSIQKIKESQYIECLIWSHYFYTINSEYWKIEKTVDFDVFLKIINNIKNNIKKIEKESENNDMKEIILMSMKLTILSFYIITDECRDYQSKLIINIWENLYKQIDKVGLFLLNYEKNIVNSKISPFIDFKDQKPKTIEKIYEEILKKPFFLK